MSSYSARQTSLRLEPVTSTSSRANRGRESDAYDVGSTRKAALGTGSVAFLSGRIEEVQQVVDELRANHAEMRDERNNRVALEEELDDHAERLETHERRAAEDLRALTQSFEAKLVRAQEQMEAGFKQQLERFKQSALRPLEDRLDAAASRRDVEDQAQAVATIEDMLGQLDARQGEDHAALGGLCEELRTEQHDHREAIGNLMDLLEKTATVEDMQREREDLDSVLVEIHAQMDAFGSRLADTSATAEVLQQDVGEALKAHGRLDELERSVADQMATTASAAVVEQISERVNTGLRELEVKAKECEHQTNRRLVDAERRSNQVTTTVEAFADNVRKQSTVSEQVVASVRSLEAKLDNTAQLLHQESEQLIRQWGDMTDGRIAVVEDKLQSSMAALVDTARSTQTSFDLAVRNVSDKADSGLAGMKRLMDSVALKAEGNLTEGRSLQQRLDREIVGLRASFDGQLGAATQRVDSTVADLRDSATRQVSQLAELERQGGSTARQQDEDRAESERQRVELRQFLTEALEDSAHDTALKQAAEITRVKGELGLEKAEVQSSLTRLEGTLETSIRATADRLDEQCTRLTDTVRAMDRALGEKNVAQDATIASHHSSLLGQQSTLEKVIGDRCGAAEVRLADLGLEVTSNHGTSTASLTRLEGRLTERVTGIEAQQDNARHQLSQLSTSLEQRLADQAEKLNERSNERATHLTQRVQDFSMQLGDRCTALDRRFSQWSGEFADEHRQTLRGLETKHDTLAAQVDSENGRLARLEGAVGTVEKVAADNHSGAAKAATEVEKRLRELKTTTDGNVSRLKSEFDGKLAGLFDSAGSLEAATKQLELATMQADKSIRANHQAMLEQGQHLERSAREKHATSVTECAGLRKALADRAEKADGLIRDSKEHFTEICHGLDGRLEQQKSVVENKLKTAHQFVTEACADIAAGSKAKDTEHDTRFAEVFRAISEKGAEAQAANTKLEEVIMGRDAAQHERVSAMTKSIAEAERRVGEQAKEQERTVRDALRDAATEAALRLEEFSHQTSTKLRELTRKVSAAESGSAEASKDLEREMTERMRVLAAEFPPLVAKHVAAVAEAERRADEDKKALGTRIGQVEVGGSDGRRLLKEEINAKMVGLSDKIEAADVAYHAALAAATKEQTDVVGSAVLVMDGKVVAASEVASANLKKAVAEAKIELEEAVSPLLEYNEKKLIDFEWQKVRVAELSDAMKQLDEELEHGRLDDLETDMQDLMLEVSMIGMAS